MCEETQEKASLVRASPPSPRLSSPGMVQRLQINLADTETNTSPLLLTQTSTWHTWDCQYPYTSCLYGRCRSPHKRASHLQPSIRPSVPCSHRPAANIASLTISLGFRHNPIWRADRADVDVPLLSLGLHLKHPVDHFYLCSPVLHACLGPLVRRSSVYMLSHLQMVWS